MAASTRNRFDIGKDAQVLAQRPWRARIAAALAALVIALTLSLVLAPQHASASIAKTDTIGTTPISEMDFDKSSAPNVTCYAGILTTQSGKVLWSRLPDEKLAMASLTKIMTAMVVLDKGNLNDSITVSKNAAKTDGSTAELRSGDVLTTEQLLYCMMLPSGNDAAVALAEHYGGRTDGFVKMMNEKAKELGMDSTSFSSPTGLTDKGNYTTCNDYTKLVMYAMKNDTFRKVVAAKSFTYKSTSRGYDIKLKNTNELLTRYEGMIGVKTGFTDKAGYCFVGAAEDSGIELYTVLLYCKSEEQRFNDCITLLNWGFKHYHNITLLDAETVVGEAVDTDYLDVTVPIVPAESVSIVGFDFDPDLTLTITVDNLHGAIEAGDKAGSIVWSRGGEDLATVDLVTANSQPAPSMFEMVQIGWTRFTSLFTWDFISVDQVINLETTQPMLPKG
ncbi:MAG: D-alanyl-D-alanine carboxypeptidase [Coriobacteriales bacterium]|nr:D-alanyl-D-alanine carboxypeptidase [Coriobacteriales bacterium]